MGLHPDTQGYYTAKDQGFEYVDKLPDMPDWLMNAIINKNAKQGIPSNQHTRIVGPGFALNARVNLERDIQLATEAMWALPPEATDDYDIWITVGQSLHSLDDSLLDEWDKWSQQSDKYRKGDCQKRWFSFSKGGGRGIGSLIHIAKENGWKPSESYKSMNVDDAQLEEDEKRLREMQGKVNTPKKKVKLTALRKSILYILINKIVNTNDTFLFTYRGNPTHKKINQFLQDNGIDYSLLSGNPHVSRKYFSCFKTWKTFLNSSVSKKICPSVIDITLVGIYADTSPA